MNKKGHEFNLSHWSPSAVAVLVAFFMAFAGNTGWAIGFFILAIVLAAIPFL